MFCSARAADKELCAILTHPSCDRNSAAILALGIASREPHFTLVLGGEPALTLCHHKALFHTILLFIQASPHQSSSQPQAAGS